jgi:predicted RNase H-like HicB family nuclease
MDRYVAIGEEEEGKLSASGFRFLPGCVSAGDTLDEAMLNAAEALELWAGAMIESVRKIPAARSLTELKADSEKPKTCPASWWRSFPSLKAYVSTLPNNASRILRDAIAERPVFLRHF